jgi:hypothetical protein
MTTAEESFDLAYARWRSTPFPKGGDPRVYGEIHADVALADSWIAETLLPFVSRRVVNPATIDVIGRLAALRAKIRRLKRQSAPEDHPAADRYLAYVDALSDVYAAFLVLANRT